jgi:peroxiredoxin Q/BCP
MSLPACVIVSVLAAALHVGDTAPDFTARDSDGQPQSLAKLLEAGPLLLAFFPKAFTPGCTDELRGLTAHGDDLKRYGARVLAISGDDAATLQRFKGELKAPFAFVPDPDGTLMRLYDVKAPVVTLAKRTTFLISRKRVIADITSGGDAIRVENALRALDKLGVAGL